VRVYLNDPDEGVVYDVTTNLVDIGVGDWWGYYFSDYIFQTVAYLSNLPPYSEATLGVEVFASEQLAAAGRLLFGPEKDVGISAGEVGVRIEDYSRRERDVFGNLNLAPRRTIQVLDYTFMVEPEVVASVRRIFENLAATAALYAADPDSPETVVFGVFNRWDTLTDTRTICECSATVEEF